MKRRINTRTIPFGEMKMTWRYGSSKGKRKNDSFIMFVKTDGTFKDQQDCSNCNLEEVCVPIVALQFKNKKSINALISMLEFFRDDIYGKTDKQIDMEANKNE